MKLRLPLALLMIGSAVAFAQTKPATTQPSAGAAGAAGAAAPSADDVMSQMLKPPSREARPVEPNPGPPLTDAKSGKGALPPNAPEKGVMREGTYVVDRTGRLTKSADGQQAEFTFDADGKAMQDPPVVILPNLKLMAMENAASSSNRDLRFRVTGMVTEYRGRNYVLLEKVVVVPDATQQF